MLPVVSSWSSLANRSIYARCGPLVLALSSWRSQPVAWIETDAGIVALVPVGLA